MKRKSALLKPSAIATAAVVAALSVSSFAPAHAQEQSTTATQSGPRTEMAMKGQENGMRGGMRGGPGMMRGQGGFLNFACADDAAERLETRLEKIAERLELTDEQQTSFDELQTVALTAQSDFAEACAVPVADTDADLIDRMQARQDTMAAHLTAMSSIMPALETFYDSLTDEQKALLTPDFGDRGGQHGPRSGERGSMHNG